MAAVSSVMAWTTACVSMSINETRDNDDAPSPSVENAFRDAVIALLFALTCLSFVFPSSWVGSHNPSTFTLCAHGLCIMVIARPPVAVLAVAPVSSHHGAVPCLVGEL